MNKHRTADKEAPDIHTVEKIGRTQALTPEGFLLCTDVPVARIGTMVYGPRETPITVHRASGVAYVTRDADALFADVTLSSAHGKAIVNEHPDVDVHPGNWKELAKGVMLNPRRGTGDEAGLMVADFLIMDAATIRDVQAGKREVSLGYEADYEQTGEGEGRQTNIIVNHVALVDRGRCGPRCAIGDHATTSLKEKSMGTKTRRRISDKALESLRKVFRDAEEELNAIGNAGMDTDGDGMEGDHPEPDGDEGNTHIHIHNDAGQAHAGAEGEDPYEQRFQAIEQALQQIMGMLGGGEQEEAPPMPEAEEGGPPVEANGHDELPDTVPDGEGPADDGGMLDGGTEGENTRDRATVGDSAALERSFRELVADAEILIPGFRVPTFDSRVGRAATVDSMCKLRRSVLDHLSSTQGGKAIVDNVMPGGRTLDKLSCGEAAMVFKAAAGAQRIVNNRAATGDNAHRLPNQGSAHKPGAIRTLADLNAFNQQYYAAGKKK